MREKIILIRQYLFYFSACLKWFASVLALETFPKKSDYLGNVTGSTSEIKTNGGGPVETNSTILDSGK